MNAEIIKIILKETGWFLLIGFSAYILSIFLFLVLESLGFADIIDDSASEFYGNSPVFFNASLFAFNVSFLFFAVLRLDLEKEKIDEWKSNRIKPNLFKFIGLGVFGALVILAFDDFEYFTLTSFIDEAELTKSYWDETKNFPLGEKLFLFVDGVIFTPIIEELYFRQSMLGSIFRKDFPNFAIFFSCAIFGIIHFDFLHIFAYLFSGIVFSQLYLKTRLLIPSITAHILINGISFAILLFT
jgi:membrane protease YdiL (CAAX protease family)